MVYVSYVKKAPFEDKKGNPYLESHHVEWLSEGEKIPSITQ